VSQTTVVHPPPDLRKAEEHPAYAPEGMAHFLR